MHPRSPRLLMPAALLAVMLSAGPALSQHADGAPRVFLMQGPAMERLRALAADNPELAPMIAQLRQAADGAPKAGPFAVTHKPRIPASGDPHDYASIAPYWWPDPRVPDGLPYISRDGRVNPQRNGPEFDAARRAQMTAAVGILALTWYFTAHEPYGCRATHLLRSWFLEPETRMNPHLRYAQAIPGRADGRGIGIIETVEWIFLLDAVGLLSESECWTPEDQDGMQRWFAEYLDWLQTSQFGQDEQSRVNNHGTWYDAQVVSFALFTDQPAIARRQIRERTLDRMDTQFADDGSQPYEIERTRSFHYSVYNLRAYFTVARLAEHVDIDLWDRESIPGQVLSRALDYVLPAATGSALWPHPEIGEIPSAELGIELLPLAISEWGDDRYREAYEGLDVDMLGRVARLVFPEFLLAGGR